MPDKKTGPPKKTKGDTAHAAARAVVGAIPFAGASAIELLNAVITPPLERRRQAWMIDISERLEKLESNGVDVAALQQNEEFISTLLYASHLAIRNHHEEKLEALRNAVINTACNQAPEAALQHMFLNFVDSLTALHLQILKFLQAPVASGGISMGGLSTLIEAEFTELRGQRSLYDQIGKDLYARGLINVESFHTTMTGSGLTQKRTTGMGDSFLRFIGESEFEQ